MDDPLPFRHSSTHRFKKSGMLRHQLPTWIAAAALAFTLAPKAGAEVYSLRLQDASPAEVGQELSRVLRAPVEVRGGEGRKVTVTLATALPTALLDRAAAMLGGTWTAKLRVTAGASRAAEAPPPPHLERNLALGLQDVPASRAFAVVARELKADLETTGNLDQRVTVLGVNASAATMLDRIADQANARWSLVYRIEATELRMEPPPPPVVPTPRVEPPSMPVAPVAAVLPRVPAAPSAPSGAAVRAALWDGIKDVVRVPPDQRAAAVAAFLRLGEQLVGSLNHLPVGERQNRLRALQPLMASWKRLYGGLAPDLQKQLAPVTEALKRWSL